MSDSSPPFDVAGFMGGYVMTLYIALILYGVTLAQVYIFTLNCQKDSTFLKGVVGTVWLLETVHSVFMLRQIHYLTIIGFGDIDAITTVDWSIGVFLVAENGIIALVQGFYVRRIWLLSGKRLLVTIGLSLLLVTCVAFHMTAAVYTFIAHTWLDFQGLFGATLCVEVANALSAALDGLIAGSMIVLFYRGKTGFKSTDNILRWLMAYSVNTGLITMIVSISIAITYSRDRESLLASGLTTISGKRMSTPGPIHLFAPSNIRRLSFMTYRMSCSLNARESLRGKHAKSGGLDTNQLELPNFQTSSTHGTQNVEARHITFSAQPGRYMSKPEPTRGILEESDSKIMEITAKARSEDSL
ncbi:unnamed protein product [Somion occarium]|uniref:DUF6534 domain-containing protein n=1 Tax=Somion occarium TaxID=3059160 RepID=A0ABP1D6Q7_9APHY